MQLTCAVQLGFAAPCHRRLQTANCPVTGSADRQRFWKTCSFRCFHLSVTAGFGKDVQVQFPRYFELAVSAHHSKLPKSRSALVTTLCSTHPPPSTI